MAPLADLVGVSRQTMVLGFQMADGLFEMVSPTSGWFMAALTLAKVPWIKWIKWYFLLSSAGLSLEAYLLHMPRFQDTDHFNRYSMIWLKTCSQSYPRVVDNFIIVYF